MASAFSDVWGFSWKLQSLTDMGGSLPRWPGLHVAFAIGLLEGALAPPRASDSRGRVGSEDALSDVILEVADSDFWNLHWSHVLTVIQWMRGSVPRCVYQEAGGIRKLWLPQLQKNTTQYLH